MICHLRFSLNQKAFDMVGHGFLLKVLGKFQLKPVLLKWITLLYHNVNNCVVAKGLPSDHFTLHRGVWQGCPLSPLFYVLFSETLAQAFQADPSFKARHVPGGCEVKCIQYVDDVACIKPLAGTLSTFQKAIGARLNSNQKDKSFLTTSFNDVLTI